MSTQQEREITIYATRGGQMKKINTAATTWGELQSLVRAEGFDLSSLLAAENINKSDLVNDLAVLPTTAFRLFLRPKQTKSGATPDRKECFSIIKAHITTFPEDKHLFSIDGKNVTQLATPVVQELVARFCTRSTTSQQVVATLDSIDNSDLSDIEKVQEAIELLSTLDEYSAHYEAIEALEELLDEVKLFSNVSSEEEELAKEAKRLGY